MDWFWNFGDELMATYAQIDEANMVINIVVGDSEWIALQPGTWVEYTDENYAYIGGAYNQDTDIFIAPQPFPSWVLDSNYDWKAPVEYPADGKFYLWDEANQVWVEVPAS